MNLFFVHTINIVSGISVESFSILLNYFFLIKSYSYNTKYGFNILYCTFQNNFQDFFKYFFNNFLLGFYYLSTFTLLRTEPGNDGHFWLGLELKTAGNFC